MEMTSTFFDGGESARMEQEVSEAIDEVISAQARLLAARLLYAGPGEDFWKQSHDEKEEAIEAMLSEGAERVVDDIGEIAGLSMTEEEREKAIEGVAIAYRLAVVTELLRGISSKLGGVEEERVREFLDQQFGK